MMRTGPTKELTREIIVDLEKKGKKTGKAIWKNLATRLRKPTRIRAKINLYKIEEMVKKNTGKVFVVPGKLLATGVLTSKVEIACFDYSEKAKERVEAQKGKVMDFKELVESKIDVSKMVIVK